MTKLTNEEVLHVANLARLNIEALEVEKYNDQLSAILSEIDRITSVDIKEDAILIAPTENTNMYKNYKMGEMLSKEDILKNAKNTDGDYLIVPKVIND